MDPFSITVGVVALIEVSVKVASGLKSFVDETRTVDTRVTLLISEVEMFQHMLETLEATNNVQPLFF